ncbi:unnamed protein product [Allacma fusca]|uniref:CRAL-TRIO domain-containing protein n=1 Tax=Allacma fusca TaxID=39272 RepID=A0A8J2KTB8_9HEXA|nr:unnamed protein product [Allacma fusca]
MMMDNSTPTREETAIEQLRSSISDIITENDTFNDDYYLLAWLKARNMKPSKTEGMIRNSLAWRKKISLNSDMTEGMMEELRKDFPIITDTTSSSDGLPIGFAHVGKVDNQKIYSKYGWATIAHYVMKVFLQFEEAMIDHNHKKNLHTQKITQDCSPGIIVIFDIDGFPLTPSPFVDSLRIVSTLLPAITSYFPFMIEHVFMINVTKIFATILKFIKPMIPSRGNTFNVYTSGEDGWKKNLKELINSEELPGFLQDLQLLKE